MNKEEALLIAERSENEEKSNNLENFGIDDDDWPGPITKRPPHGWLFDTVWDDIKILTKLHEFYNLWLKFGRYFPVKQADVLIKRKQ